VYGEENYGSKRTQNYLRDEDINDIVNSYNSRETIDRFSRVVEVNEVKENNYNLNVSRYIDTTERTDTRAVPEIWSELEAIEKEQEELSKELEDSLEEFGYEI